MHLTTLPFSEQLRYFLGQLLTHPEMMPEDWLPQATTYDLPRHYSQEVFEDNVKKAIGEIHQHQLTDPALIQQLLVKCGLPYDYARLGQPLSTLYEMLIKEDIGKEGTAVMSFASKTKSFLSLIEARPDTAQKISLYSKGEIPLSGRYKAELSEKNVYFYEHTELPELDCRDNRQCLCVYVHRGPYDDALKDLKADAVTYEVEDGGVLCLNRLDKVSLKALQVIRKRTVSALLPHHVLATLAERFDLTTPALPEVLPIAPLKEQCHGQLQQLFGHMVDSEYFCTGLAAEAAVFQATAHSLEQSVPVKLYYAENGYGGTGQLIGELLPRTERIEATPLKVLQEDANGQTRTLVDHFIGAIEQLKGEPVILFVETPTNPELQMHDFEKLMEALRAYHQQHGTYVPVLVDTTMAPLYDLFAQPFARDWPFLVVKSGSKYFTRGKATLGVVMANGHPLAQSIMQNMRVYGQDADAFAKASQMAYLAAGLQDLRPRMEAITQNTRVIAHHLQQEMALRGLPFTLYTMSDEQLEQGLLSGIISFYLPPVPNQTVDLVDEFVDYLLKTIPEYVKNRVSYGQANHFIYVINPEESTQGALSKEVKEAQKKDNVQICRLSVPAHCEPEVFNQAVSAFLELKYGATEPS